MNHTRADVDEDGLEGGVAKSLDDEASEGCLQWIGHVMAENCGHQEPDFDILEGLDDLWLLVVGVLDSSLVGLKTLDCNEALTVVQETGSQWGIW